MNRKLLLVVGMLNLLLAIFKIAMPYLFHWKEAMGSGQAFMWSTVYAENLVAGIYVPWHCPSVPAAICKGDFFLWDDLKNLVAKERIS